MEQKYIYDLHSENVEQLKKTDFYKHELQILKKRLSEIAAKNTSKEVQTYVERFQNQLIIQQNELQEMRHNIKQQENSIEENLTINPTAVDHRKVEVPLKLDDQVATFEKLFATMRQELNSFFAKNL